MPSEVLAAFNELRGDAASGVEIRFKIALVPTGEGSGSWSSLHASTLVPGLAEALSTILETKVATWFWDPTVKLARFELRFSGGLVSGYPSELGVAGTEAGLRRAAEEARVPLGWDPPTGKVIEASLRT